MGRLFHGECRRPREMTNLIDIGVVEKVDSEARRLGHLLEHLPNLECRVVREPEPEAASQMLGDYDLLVLDVPGTTAPGDVLWERLRETDGPPVLISCSSDFAELEEQALEVGALGLFRKKALDRELLEEHVAHASEQRSGADDSRELLRTLRAFEHAKDGLVICDATDDDHPIVYCNEGFLSLTGYSESEVIGRNCRFLQCDETSEETSERIREALEAEEPVDVEILNERADGEKFWNELSITPVRDTSGEVVDFFGFQRDVTRRVEAERRLEEYEVVVDHTTNGIVLKDPEGVIRLVNQQFVEMVGGRREDFVGRHFSDVVGPLDAVEMREYHELAMRSGEPVSRRKETETDGEVQIRDIVTIPVRHGGETTGTLDVLSDVTQQERLRRQLEQKALYDELTGLPNESLFRERLGAALTTARTSGEPLTVAVVDLDNFGEVNESYGFAVGDELLARIAERFEDLFDHCDTVARLAGDRFGVLLRTAADRTDVEYVADAMAAAFESPVAVTGASLNVQMSKGFAHLAEPGRSSESLELHGSDLIEAAEDAMVRAKRSPGVSRWIVSPGHTERVDLRMETENQICLGLQRDEFVPYFQPIEELEGGGLRGFEVLARWLHPERGLLLPSTFIEVAQDTGLLVDITASMLERTTRMFDRVGYPESWPSPLRLHVNLSTAQLAATEIEEGLDPLVEADSSERLELSLEISESQVLDRFEAVEDLRDGGFRIVVDNFGAGDSPLLRLADLPMDELKLDIDFVHGAVEDEKTRAVLETVVELGRRLEVPVLGSGVETSEQFDLVRKAGCTAAQGFLIGRPSPLQQLVVQSH